MPKEPSQPKSLEPIDPLDLSKVNRIRDRIGRVLSGAAIIGAVSAGTGGAAGLYARSEYRDWSGYDPDQTSEVAEDEEKEEPVVSEKIEVPENETWREKAERIAKEKINKVNKWANEEAGKKVDKLPVIREYKEAVREMNEFKRKALEAGDKAAFWIPFILMFLATTKLALLAIRINRSIQNIKDPERSKKHDATEAKINEMIRKLNALSEAVQEGGQMNEENRKRVAELAAEFETMNESEDFAETSGVTNLSKTAI